HERPSAFLSAVSKSDMRLGTIGIAALALLSACSPKRVPAVVDVQSLQARLAAADELVRVGCFDCLSEALRTYESLRAQSAAPTAMRDAATAGAIRTATLLDLRERELGMLDGGNLQRARNLAAAGVDV